MKAVRLIIEIMDDFNECIKANPSLKGNLFKIPKNQIDSIISTLIDNLSGIIGGRIEEHFEESLDDLINFNSDYFKIKVKNILLSKRFNKNLSLNTGNIEFESDYSDSSILMQVSSDEKYYSFNIDSKLLDQSDWEGGFLCEKNSGISALFKGGVVQKIDCLMLGKIKQTVRMFLQRHSLPPLKSKDLKGRFVFKMRSAVSV